MTGTLTVPTIGQPNSTEDVDIRDALNTLNGLLTASNLLDGAQLGATTVAAASLASNAVTTAKILDANVTAAKLAGDAVVNANVSSTAAIAGSKLDTGDGRLVQTTGIATASADLGLTTSYADVTGATVTFTPDVACFALVTAVFDFNLTAASGLDLDARGALVVDAAVQTPEAIGASVDPSTSNPTQRVTASQVYRVALTAASHTLKLQAKKQVTGTGTATCKAANTQLLYQLVAQ